MFAEAYQIKTGGSLKGADARAALMKAMEDGKVKSDILPLVSQLMNELSKGGIEKARTSSIAEQARFQNTQTRMLMNFSESGGESGFARLWRTAADAMREMDRMAPRIGEFFDKGTQFLRQAVLLPQSIGRMFDGRDSNFQKWLFGEGETGEKVMTMMFNIKDLFSGFADLGKLAFEGWSQLFGFLKEQGFIDTLLEKLITLQRSLLLVIDAVKTASEGDLSGAFGKMRDATILAAPDMASGVLMGFKSQEEVLAEKARILEPFRAEDEKRKALRDPASIFYNDAAGYDQFQKDKALAAAYDQKTGNSSSSTSFSFGDINVTLPEGAGADDAQRAQMFANMLQNAINEAIPSFNTTQ